MALPRPQLRRSCAPGRPGRTRAESLLHFHPHGHALRPRAPQGSPWPWQCQLRHAALTRCSSARPRPPLRMWPPAPCLRPAAAPPAA
eukprot:3644986-Pleurochrysis_carterae.AAC.2